jgi:vitamin B12 transporter
VDIPWGAKGSRGARNSQGTAGSKAGSLLISGHYESLRFANTSNITKLDPYFLLNVTVNQQIGKNLTVFAVGRNLLNASYESLDEYPMPGITVTLGVRFNVELSKEKSSE